MTLAHGQLRLVCLMAALLWYALPVYAQTPPTADSTEAPGIQAEEAVSIFPHSSTSRFWISGQINNILQWHPTFRAKYRGENSLRAPTHHSSWL